MIYLNQAVEFVGTFLIFLIFPVTAGFILFGIYIVLRIALDEWCWRKHIEKQRKETSKSRYGEDND